MRTLVVCNIMSPDGDHDGPGGDVMVLPMDPAFDIVRRADAHRRIARVTHERG